MKTHYLTTPIKDEDLEGIKIGDIVYLNGYLITSRDDVHMRLVKQHRALPVDLAGKAIFHAGPIMVSCGSESGSGYKVVSIGPTTSMRMEKFEREFIRDTGVKLIVGKGGMGPNTEAGCRDHKALHCVWPGGCAVLAASKVEEVEAHYWGKSLRAEQEGLQRAQAADRRRNQSACRLFRLRLIRIGRPLAFSARC